ncbi:uncharacterized protein C8A04DRAFT_24129 [Dichotomopilus funicola]|uniref:Uncharacterized protein n=1 Tax=Dichotomopilus funicola TaxID=1934379 RepID=A0AAN6VD36_9PEZI|nr:hypothetical protein C8A04DRAFT_24129 [Dichotomopilus funicola]
MARLWSSNASSQFSSCWQCPVVALWNTAELVAASFSRHGGIHPNIHVVIDGILFLAVATAAGTLLVDVICGLTDYGPRFTTAGQEITSVCLLVVMMVIHSFLLFFFVCNYVEQLRTKSTKPAASQFPVPQYAPGAAPWSSPLSATTTLHRAPTGHESTKFGPSPITMELRNSPSALRREPPAFGLSVQPQPAPAVALSAVIESSVIAQAMSGVWDAETGSGQQVGLAPPAYEGPLGSTAADRSSSFDGGRYA